MTDQLLETKPRLRIDPRFRQRRIDVKREEGRKRLRALTVAIAVIGLLAVSFLAAHSPLLAVRHVHILGASRTSVSSIAEAAGIAGRPPMIDVSPGGAARAVDRLPWIDRAVVRRQWPGTITITVSERVPVAAVGLSAGPVMVDRTGRILAPAGAINLPAVLTDGDPALGGLPGGGSIDRPVIAAPPGAAGSNVDAVYRPGVLVASMLTPTLLARLTKIVVSGDGSVRLGLIGGGAALLGGVDGMADKLLAVETLLDRSPVGKGTIDVTVPSAPVVLGGGA